MLSIHNDKYPQYEKIWLKEKDTIIAFHEAGHAIACILLKKKFSYVTIRAKEKRFHGKVMDKTQWSNLRYILEGYECPEQKKRKVLRRQISISFAGDIAVQLYFLSYHNLDLTTNKEDDVEPYDENKYQISISPDYGDDGNIKEYLDLMGLKGAAKDEEYVKLYSKTYGLLYDNFAFICYVAKALLDKKKLGYFQVREIMKGIRDFTQRKGEKP